MALKVGAEDSIHLSANESSLLKNGPTSIEDLLATINGQSIIWWAVNYNDKDLITKVNNLVDRCSNFEDLKLIDELLKYNFLKEIPEGF